MYVVYGFVPGNALAQFDNFADAWRYYASHSNAGSLVHDGFVLHSK